MAVFAKGGALHGEGLGGVCARLDVLVSEMISITVKRETYALDGLIMLLIIRHFCRYEVGVREAEWSGEDEMISRSRW